MKLDKIKKLIKELDLKDKKILMGYLGGLVSGKARFKGLTKKQRSERMRCVSLKGKWDKENKVCNYNIGLGVKKYD